MKFYHILAFLVIILSNNLHAQDQDTKAVVKVGDTFTIAEVADGTYQHIDLPRANFIIKKGGIANYGSIVGKKVEVVSLKEKRGATIATLKLSSGKRFFNSHRYITVVNINKAIAEKELIK